MDGGHSTIHHPLTVWNDTVFDSPVLPGVMTFIQCSLSLLITRGNRHQKDLPMEYAANVLLCKALRNFSANISGLQLGSMDLMK